MTSIGSTTTSTAALQAADKTTDKALADATAKLAADRRAKAGDATLRADQKSISTATKTASNIDAQLAKATASSTQAQPQPGGGLKLTA